MITRIQTVLATTALAMTLMMGAQTASAALIEIGCDTLNFTTSTSCISPVSGGPGGNVTEDEMNNYTNVGAFGAPGAFGYTGWMELAAIGSITQPADTEVSQNSTPFLFTFSFTDEGPKGGTWSLNPAFTWGSGVYAFAIKGSTDNAVYLMDTGYTSGEWMVSDLFTKSGQNPDLSNVALFGTADLSPVPLPAAGWLLLGGLGGLAALRRRRKAA